MATIKSYTDIEQSRKLAEILPLESADGYWDFQIDGYNLTADKLGYYKNDSEIPCWSLAALLSIIRETVGYALYGANNIYMSCDLGGKPWKLEIEEYNNEVDACVAMVEKLNELNLL